MKPKLLFLVTLLILLIIGYSYISEDFKKAKPTVYYNGTILTLEEQLPIAQALFVEDGIIKALGTNAEIDALITAEVNRVDLKGATVLPGFIDSHTHVALSAFLESMIDLSGFTHKTNSAVWNYLKQEIKHQKEGEWVVCNGVDPVFTKNFTAPNIAFLDEISPENPIILISQSLHTYWANTKAFQLLGITKDTKDPSASSYYEKDANGNLTGLIVEQEAFAPFLLELKNSVFSSENLIHSTSKVLKNYAKNGNTTVVSAGLTISDAKPLRLYEHLSGENPSFINQVFALLGKLPKRSQNPRHFAYIRFDRASLLPKKKTNNDFFNILGIKHWYDGSPYTGSMYMEEPYITSELAQKGLHIPEGYSGKPLIKQEDLIRFIKKYHKKGWQIAIHTQGDIANENVISAFEAANKEVDIKNGRHRLEHCLLLSESSMSIMKDLNLSPSFHINHIYYYGDDLKKSIFGEERANTMLPLFSAQQKKLKFSIHADQPMFESNPLRLIQTAVERTTRSGDTLGVNQRITVLNAIKAMTINAAWQIHMENKIGSLKIGKYADFVILDKNPLQVHTSKIQDIKILKTVVNGNIVE